MSEPYATIEAAHVGQPGFTAFGHTWSVSTFIGRILPADVGKRVYLRDGILQVENDAQRLARHQREATEALQALGAGAVVHLSAEPQPDPFYAIYDSQVCDLISAIEDGSDAELARALETLRALRGDEPETDPQLAEDEPRRPCDDDRGCGSRACISCYGAE